MKPGPLPITYRTTEVDRIMRALAAGESGVVLGIGSVGKSNLLRFLAREDVREAKLGDHHNNYLFAYIDTNKMLEFSVWGLAELMLHQLLISLTNKDVDDEMLRAVDRLYQRATDPQTRYLALRYLDRVVNLVCNQLHLSLVFLIDEFDELTRRMSSRGFTALRALRDDHKYHLMYLVALRLQLKWLREDILEIEPFEELVSTNKVWLGPYSESDARDMLQRLTARYEVYLDKETVRHLLAVTGGHPGLLRTTYKCATEYPKGKLGNLSGNPKIKDECRRVWFSLDASEQSLVLQLTAGVELGPEEATTLRRLRRKGVVGGTWVDDGALFSPLFGSYVEEQQPTVGARIQVDRERRSVWVNGRAIVDLPPLEYKFIEYLESKRGEVCSRNELAQHLYPREVYDEGVSDGRLDAVVKRLRKRVEPVPGEQRYVETVWGQGFRLIDGGEKTA